MNVNKKPKLTTRLKEHWNTHKFTYGYFTGATVALAATYITLEAQKKADDALWDEAQAEAEAFYSDREAMAIRTRDGLFGAVTPKNQID